MSLTTDITDLESCVIELHKVGAVKFGNFTLKSGNQSPIYFDLRVIVSYPKLLEMVSTLIWKSVAGEKFDHLCGVPYTALPIATAISIKQNIPMLIRRKEAKSYGTKKLIEGVYKEGQSCLIIEDVVVSGSSVYETVELLRNERLDIKKAVVFLDREQGGGTYLSNLNVNMVSVFTIREMLKILQKFEKLDEVTLTNAMNYLDKNTVLSIRSTSEVLTNTTRNQSFGDRANKTPNPLARRLFTLMDQKETNVCVAVDVETSKELLDMADKLGPSICMLKTHVDIIKDFSSETIEALKALSTKHNFLIFEDRKLADIGNTVKHQYKGGMYRIFDWAHLVTVHGIAGPGCVKALMEGSIGERGCIIVAEMSSDQNLIRKDYVKGCVKIGEDHKDFVLGFVCQSSVTPDPNFILFTPGVHLNYNKDSLGQKYVTPAVAIKERDADIIIVGRGITKSEDPVKEVELYKKLSYMEVIKRAEESAH